jgi:uncharacterized protein YndB with AHSA1/START domain
MSNRSVKHATFTIERNYDASPARVFKAHSDKAAKRRWFVEGEGWNIESYEIDFRVGGWERSSFRFKDGPFTTFEAVYHDIVPNERIIVAYAMTLDGKQISVSLATTELKSAGSGTRLVFTEQGAYLDGHDDVKGREEGSRALFEALAKEVSRTA